MDGAAGGSGAGRGAGEEGSAALALESDAARDATDADGLHAKACGWCADLAKPHLHVAKDEAVMSKR
eukprot:3779509-Prymnesium_polylepis.2